MDTLNQLIAVRLRPEWLVRQHRRLHIYREELREEKVKLTRQLLGVYYSPAGPREKEAVVQAMQLSIVQWLDCLHTYRAAFPAPGQAPAQLYLEAEGLLHDVLVALEQHVPSYLSPYLAFTG